MGLLKNINPILTADLLYVLRAMGWLHATHTTAIVMHRKALTEAEQTEASGFCSAGMVTSLLWWTATSLRQRLRPRWDALRVVRYSSWLPMLTSC
jgi:hypothetical protein